MRASRFGRSALTDLLRSKTDRLCASVFLVLFLLMSGCPRALPAQPPQSSTTNPPPNQSRSQPQDQPQDQPRAQPKATAGQGGASSSGQANSPAQPQDQSLGQGDQSLQPDPLANPVNPPPTPVNPPPAPEEPAADDPGASWIAPPSAPSPASGADALAPARPAASAQGTASVADNHPAASTPPPVPLPAKASNPLRQQINNQCADLLTMANALKMEVDKTTKDELSVTVVRKADQIEQLAHKVKDEMRPTLSRN